MPKLLLLNGPNLNLLGSREPEKYGHETLADVEVRCQKLASEFGFDIECLQSNIEGELINAIHKAGAEYKAGELAGVVFNPGAYTHTSIALHDAIAGVGVPVVEVHITNVHARESFRHHSYISPVAAGTIIGMGTKGYQLAINYLLEK
ncbi:type II 3-dehydroquinate dehydratase [Vibrio sp. EA2]|jgi:3-dehydroquinate dehydratase-2|uniref:type II 3-dehydroquinate dehydratase n=1 Tax=Vibrio sp. EA2 TaxID=3079860 RepID=UPI00294904AE|nr:type II 3-dehydroquinate dehydratase [Vibrio sp. EA2]MDV6249834.1 type II 3-dehydroquinate dehydratase [Vibrio sp. EA2]